MPDVLIVFAKVARKPQRTLDQLDFTKDVQKAIDPTSTILRYKRTWRFSQPIRRQNFLVGKLGFTRPGETAQMYYDEQRKDFVEQVLPAQGGGYAQWVINMGNQVMAFETRPPLIRLQTFLGNFKALLDEHRELALTVEQIVESKTFYDWVAQVDRIIRFEATLRAPNPDFAHRPQSIINLLLQETNADRAKISVSKEPDSPDGIAKQSNLVKDIVTYGEDGYSTVKATGWKDNDQKTFNSLSNAASQHLNVPETADAKNIWELLIQALTKFRPT